MNVWFLSVFMWINGAWVPGGQVDIDGWSPREYESEKICLLRREFTVRSLKRAEAAGKDLLPTHWVCNEGEPLVQVPDDLGPPTDS